METFTCAMCGGVFESTNNEGDKREELAINFGVDFKPEDCEIVCDECYTYILEQKERFNNE